MSSRRRLAGPLHGIVHSGWQRRKEQSKNMDRKWRCKRNARGPRGPPGLFPAVCPCEAVCAAFPVWVASLPHPPPKTALSRPVSRVCGEELESAGAVGTQGLRGTKKVRDKERGSRSAPAHATPPRNAGRGRGSRRGYDFGLGGQVCIHVAGNVRCCRIFRGSRRGYGSKSEKWR